MSHFGDLAPANHRVSPEFSLLKAELWGLQEGHHAEESRLGDV